MLLSEYLGTTNIFSLLRNINHDLIFINDETVNQLNSLLLINYGSKEVFSKIIPYPHTMVAEFIDNIYSSTWINLIELNVIQSDIMKGDVRTITETITETENKVNENVTLNKVSAFNSDDLLTDTGNSSSNTDNATGNKIRELKDVKTNFKEQYENLLLSHKTHIINVVLDDVSNLLTLSIY